MGYMRNHTIVVSSGSKERIEQAKIKAEEIFKEEFSKDVVMGGTSQ